MKQRNIPVTEKVPVEVQTDIQLLNQQLFESLVRPTLLSQDQLTSITGLQYPHSDQTLLALLRRQIGLFRNSTLEGLTQEQLRKRLNWVQAQVEGLTKRGLNYKSENGLTDYYTHISELQAKLDKQLIITNNYQLKLAKCTSRIAELQSCIEKLNVPLLESTALKTENNKLKDCFLLINDIFKDTRKLRDLEGVVSREILPIVNEFDVKFDDVLKKSNVTGRASSSDPRNRIKSQIQTLLRALEKLTKNPQQLTVDNVEKQTVAFLKELNVGFLQEQVIREDGTLYKHLYQDLKQRYSATASLYKTRSRQIIENNPTLNIADVVDDDQVKLLEKEDIIVSKDSRFITMSSSSAVRHVLVQDEKTKALITVLSKEFKKLLKAYPKLRDQVSCQIVDFVTNQVFDDAIQLDELDRIGEVVRYKPDVIRVDNFYEKNQQNNLRQIFHLRVFVKVLLDELNKLAHKTKEVLEIDEGVLKMVGDQIQDICDPEDVLRVFRSVPKVVEVDRIVERDVGKYNILTQGQPIVVHEPVFIDRLIERPVIVEKNVPTIQQQAVNDRIVQQVPVTVSVEVPVAVDVVREKVVERIIETEVVKPVETIVEVPVYQTQIQQIDRQVPQERIVEVLKEAKCEIAVNVKDVEIKVLEVERFEERLVPVIHEITNIKEVKMNTPYPVEEIKYIELENVKNNFIYVPETKEVVREVACIIEHTLEKPVISIETIEKVVVQHTREQIVKEVPVQKQRILVQEKPVPYREQVTHVVRGNREEVLVEVERITQVPLIREVLVTRDVEIQKAVAVEHRVQVPVIVELNLPYIQYEPEIITCEVEKIVTFREQTPYEVIRQVPVPVVIEKECIKPVRIIVEKIIEKIVEVPRVVEVEKIVEKIVVVPRIIEHIVTVPQIVQVIVEKEVEVLKIVEIIKQVPVYYQKEVIKTVIQRVEVPIEKIVYQTLEKDKLVTLRESIEILKEIQVQRRIPVELLRELPVNIQVEKIVERLIEVFDIQIKDREVIVPFRHEIAVEVNNEKAVPVRTFFENIISVPQIITKPQILYETKIVPQIVEINVEKPIDRVKEVVFNDVRHVIQHQIKYVDVPKEICVVAHQIVNKLQPEPYIVQKLVYINNIHEQGVEVRCEKPVELRNDVLVSYEKSVNYIEKKQVVRNITNDRFVETRTLVDQIKAVQVAGPEKVITVKETVPEVVTLKEQVPQELIKEIVKIVDRNIAVKQETIQKVEVPGQTVICREVYNEKVEVPSNLLLEKPISRISILPQIVEVIRHHYEITEERNANLCIEGDPHAHREKYIGLLQSIIDGLQKQADSLRNSPEQNDSAQRAQIQSLIELLNDLYKFPLIVEVPKEVEKIVQKVRIVNVGSSERQANDREIGYAVIIEKMIQELKRIRREHNIPLKLDEQVCQIFFDDLQDVDNLKQKLQQFSETVVNKFKSLGAWNEGHAQMLHEILQERFLMAAIINEANNNSDTLKEEVEALEYERAKLKENVTKLSITNINLKTDLFELSKAAQKLVNNTDQATEDKNQLKIKIDQVIKNTNFRNILEESRFSQAYNEENEKLRSTIRNLEQELDGFRGGEESRNLQLASEIQTLRSQLDILNRQRREYSQSDNRATEENRRIIQLSRENQDANRRITNLQEELKKATDAYNRLTQEVARQQSGRGSTLLGSIVGTNEDKLKTTIRELQNKVRDLENRIRELEALLAKANTESARKSIEVDEIKRRMLDSQITGAEIRSTVYPPRPQTYQGPRTDEKFQSPETRPIGRYNTPADQLRFTSPQQQEPLVRPQLQEASQGQSSSSRISVVTSQNLTPVVRRNLTIRQLIQEKLANENVISQIIIRVVEKIQEECSKGKYALYSPDSITLLGYSAEAPEQIKIRLGDPVDRSRESTRIYLSPEVLRGENATEKSCIFNIGVIWDELVHSDPYFKSAAEVETTTEQFKVRNARLNPIFKNTLFEMLIKDQKKRIEFTEIKRRLSLQKFIAIEERRFH